jgi:putative aldouronate transport system substrate-binding protein
MKKRILAMAILTMAVLGLSSCQKQTAVPQVSSGGGREKGTLPLTDQNVTFRIFFSFNFASANVSSTAYTDNLFTKKVTDETGISIEFITSPGSATERLNAMLSSGDYPDIIMAGLGKDIIEYYAQQGIFISVDKYDPLSYPSIKAAFEKYPQLEEMMRLADGELHGFARLSSCIHCEQSNGRIFYFMPWVRDNNRKIPETTDELTEYLRWVRDNDVNGNGNPHDEIGIAFTGGETNSFIAGIARAFMPFVNTPYFGLALGNNKEITRQYRDSRFRDTLRYLAALYQEGLILEDTFSLSGDQMRTLLQNPDPLVAIHGIGWSHTYLTGERFINYLPLTPLKGPSGERYQGHYPWSGIEPFFFITDKCQDPELALAFYNYLIDRDVTLDGYYGVKGIGWDDPDPGAKGFDGNDNPVYKTFVTFGTAGNISWGEGAIPFIRDDDWFFAGHQAEDTDSVIKWLNTGDPSVHDAVLNNTDYLELMYYIKAKEFAAYYVPAEIMIPPIVMTESDLSRTADINAVLNPYRNLALVEFIIGTRNISSDAAWSTYLQELDRYGDEELVSIIQKYVK